MALELRLTMNALLLNNLLMENKVQTLLLSSAYVLTDQSSSRNCCM